MSQLVSPAASRNLPPLLEKLTELLPPTGRVLEMASGPGQHLMAYAKAFPALTWQGSDIDPEALASINAWRSEAALPNVAAALTLDASDPHWPTLVAGPIDAIIVVNMCHISPWSATEGLVHGAAQVLAARAPLIIYGPFKRNGAHTAPSNAQFDASLRARDASWGVRDVDDINALARVSGLIEAVWHPMPSNNAVLELRKP